MSKITVTRVRISHLSLGTCTVKLNVAKSYIEGRKTSLTYKIQTIFMFLGLENWEQPRLRWETCKAGTFLKKNDPETVNLGKILPIFDTIKKLYPYLQRAEFLLNDEQEGLVNNLKLVYVIYLPSSNQFPQDIFFVTKLRQSCLRLPEFSNDVSKMYQEQSRM